MPPRKAGDGELPDFAKVAVLKNACSKNKKLPGCKATLEGFFDDCWNIDKPSTGTAAFVAGVTRYVFADEDMCKLCARWAVTSDRLRTKTCVSCGRSDV